MSVVPVKGFWKLQIFNKTWCHFIQHVCHLSSSVVCRCFLIHSFQFKTFSRAHTAQWQTEYLFAAKVIVEYVPQSSAHNASPAHSERHRWRECPCWDLRWPFSKVAGEPERANKAGGCGCCWTTGGRGPCEAPAPTLVSIAPPCAVRHCQLGAQPHPPQPGSGHSSIHPAWQGWYRSALLLMSCSPTHPCREGCSQAPLHHLSLRACIRAPGRPARVLGVQGDSHGCTHTHAAGRFPVPHFTFYPL